MYLHTTQTITLPSTFFISESVMASHYSLSDEYDENDDFYDEADDDESYYGDSDDSDDDFWDDSNDD
jgi:hypothetical protein